MASTLRMATAIVPDEEEDRHAKVAAEEALPRDLPMVSLPPFIGIRIKPFSPELRDRSIRTLNLFLEFVVRSHARTAARKLRDYLCRKL